MTGAVPLERSSAEAKGEQVFRGRRGVFSYVVDREYEGAPWAWIIQEGDTLIAAGDAPDHRSALMELCAELDQLDPPPERKGGGGLVGLVGRLLWGDE